MSTERLGKLIALLPPAPAAWVRKAEHLFASSGRERQSVSIDHAAALVTDAVAADQTVATVVARRQIVAALAQETAELRLELVRSNDELQREGATISVRWSKQELERLLERARGEQVVLTFDQEQLAQAFAEVEAHIGQLRTLSVAVAPTDGLSEDQITSGAIAITAATFTLDHD